MAQEILQRKNIKKCVLPQLKNLESLFLNLNLKSSLIALDVLKSVFNLEINQPRFHGKKSLK